MFSEKEYALLSEFARKVDKPLSQIVRECVETYLVSELLARQKEDALQWFLAGEDPIGEWMEIESSFEKRPCGRDVE